MTDVGLGSLAAASVIAAPRGHGTLRRLLRHRSFMIGFSVILLLTLAAVLAPLISPVDPSAMRVRLRFRPPSSQFRGKPSTNDPALTVPAPFPSPDDVPPPRSPSAPAPSFEVPAQHLPVQKHRSRGLRPDAQQPATSPHSPAISRVTCVHTNGHLADSRTTRSTRIVH